MKIVLFTKISYLQFAQAEPKMKILQVDIDTHRTISTERSDTISKANPKEKRIPEQKR